MPTTRKDTRRVVPKREVVRRDRGWRWGVMATRGFEAETNTSCCCHWDKLATMLLVDCSASDEESALTPFVPVTAPDMHNNNDGRCFRRKF